MFKCRMGTKWYACFKSEHIEKMKGSAVIFVGPRQLDLSDGKILTTMEWLMVFAKVPL